MTTFSKTQIDRLGDRLRKGSLSEDDLKLLDEYRRSFGEAYETVVRIIRDQLNLDPTGRPAKSTNSVIEKLYRESIRLSQVQDIAGCRVVVADVSAQQRLIISLRDIFPTTTVIDRRADPSYGYRAVHVIARIVGKSIEIQIRTQLQHLWADLSEKLSDVVDPSIKYGGGESKIRETLMILSAQVAEGEALEKALTRRRRKHVTKQYKQETQKFREELAQWKTQFIAGFNQAISSLESRKGQKQ